MRLSMFKKIGLVVASLASLVHEAYLRLVDQRQVEWRDRGTSWRSRPR